jgi:hypothetical protein
VGIKILDIKDTKNNLVKKDIQIKEREPEYPSTVTEIIIKLKSIDQLEKINFSDINGFLIDINTLFSKDELNDILKDYTGLINHIKAKINLLLYHTKQKKIFYKINTHSQDLISKNTSNYEIEAILDIKTSNKINILLENIKSSSEIKPIKEISDNDLGVIVNKIQKTILEDYIANGIEYIDFDLDKIDIKELKKKIKLQD